VRCQTGGVLLLLAEDSLKKTVLQRLDAAGADMRRISVPNRPVLIPRDLSLIEEIACQIQASLIVIDPIMAFLGVDSNGDQKVRGALTPLKSFAEKTGVAVVLVRHLTKRGGVHALSRGTGSIGIIAATRSALLVGRSPDEPKRLAENNLSVCGYFSAVFSSQHLSLSGQYFGAGLCGHIV